VRRIALARSKAASAPAVLSPALSAAGIDDVIAFLATLTDGYVP
jgi:hypothetical protein